MPLTSTVVLQRLSNEQMPVDMVAGRDEWWHEVVPAADASCPVEWVESEAPLKCMVDSLARPCIEVGMGNTREENYAVAPGSATGVAAQENTRGRRRRGGRLRRGC